MSPDCLRKFILFLAGLRVVGHRSPWALTLGEVKQESEMAFNADILVTESGSSHELLLVEVKTNASSSQSEPQLKRYLWEMSCPIGLFVSPRSIVLYRNLFTSYSDDCVKKVGEFASPKTWRVFERPQSGAEFETRV
jgi:hypothetical protein